MNAPTGTSTLDAPEIPSELRRARIATAATFFIHGSATGTLAARVPYIAAHVHAGAGELGLALIAPGIGAMLTMPFSGRLVHRYDAKSLTRVLLVIWCLSLVLPALPTTLWLLCAVLLLFGAAAGLSDVAMNSQAVLVESRYGRSVMSGLHGGWSAGALFGSGLSALAAKAGVDARIEFLVVALALAVAGYCVGTGLLSHRAPVEDDEPPAFALPSRQVLFIGLVGLCAVFGEGASMDWSAVYVRSELSGSAVVSALAVSAFAGTMAVTRILGDALVGRVGPVGAVRMGAVSATAGAVAVAVAPSVGVAVIGFAFLGAGVAVVVPLVFAAAGRIGPHPGRSIAGAAGVAYGSGLVAPGIIGGIAHVSSLAVSFGVVAVLTTVMGLGASLLRPPAS